MRRLLLLGRLLFGGVFVWAAVEHMLSYDALTASVAAQNVPYPELAVALSTLLLAVGGSSIILGFQPRVGLGLILLFLVPVSYVMHAFWAAPDQAAKSVQLAMFMKNVALMGASFALFAIPTPWPLSVDSWLEKNGHHFGSDAFARGWQRMIAGTKRALRHVQPHARSSTQSLARRPPIHASDAWLSDEAPLESGGYVVRRWAAWTDDGSVMVQTRSYQIW